jgi:hypothetical protein
VSMPSLFDTEKPVQFSGPLEGHEKSCC